MRRPRGAGTTPKPARTAEEAHEMKRLLDDRLRGEVREALGDLPAPVTLTLFTRAGDCPTCPDLERLLGELAEVHESVRLEMLDFDRDRDRAAALGVDEAPAFAVTGAEDRGVRFVGTPAGMEFATLISAIRGVARGASDLPEALQRRLASLDRPMRIRVFVTPTCPYCPPAVSTAHQIALASTHVRAEMVEAMEFPELADRFAVRGVPRIVIDDRVAIEGAIPAPQFVDAVMRAAAAR
jgi:glutaredoxin-like protein